MALVLICTVSTESHQSKLGILGKSRASLEYSLCQQTSATHRPPHPSESPASRSPAKSAGKKGGDKGKASKGASSPAKKQTSSTTPIKATPAEKPTPTKPPPAQPVQVSDPAAPTGAPSVAETIVTDEAAAEPEVEPEEEDDGVVELEVVGELKRVPTSRGQADLRARMLSRGF